MDSRIVHVTAQPSVRVEDWCDQVRRSQLGLFALINPVPSSIPRTVRGLTERAAVNLFATRTTNVDVLAVGPRLLHLSPDIDKPVSHAIGSQDAEMPWGTLVSSSLSMAPLADRLRRRIDVTAEGEDMMLRYWDPRVMLNLHCVLGEVARHHVFAFGKQALVSDRRGGCIALGLTCPDDDPVETMPVALDREAMLALGQASQVDAVLGLLRQGSPAALDAIADTDRYPLAKSQLDACLERGLRSPRDHALTLSLAIEHGPSWWHDEAWAPVLEQAKQATLLKAYTDHLEVA